MNTSNLNLSLNMFNEYFDKEEFLFFYRNRIKNLLFTLNRNKYSYEDIINIYVFIYRANKIYFKNIISHKDLKEFDFIFEIFDLLQNLSFKVRNKYLKKAFFSTLLLNYYIINYNFDIKNTNTYSNIIIVNFWFYIYNYIENTDLNLILNDYFLLTLYNIFQLDFLLKKNIIENIFPKIKQEIKKYEYMILFIITLNKKKKMIKKKISFETLLLNILKGIFLTQKKRLILNNINFPYISKNLNLYIYIYINIIQKKILKLVKEQKSIKTKEIITYFEYISVINYLFKSSKIQLSNKIFMKIFYQIYKLFLQILIEKNSMYENKKEVQICINKLKEIKLILNNF